MLVDTGQTGFFYFNTSRVNYYEKEDIVEILAESEGALISGIHGIASRQKHLLLNISELVIGNFPFNDVISTTVNKIDSRIGAKLLEYGSVVFDFKKKRFYFKPFDNISTDDLSLKPATFGFTVQNNKLVVIIIWDKALKSVINLGDEILNINGIDIQSWDICQLYALDNIPDIDEPYIELKDIKTGAIKRIEYKPLSFFEAP